MLRLNDPVWRRSAPYYSVHRRPAWSAEPCHPESSSFNLKSFNTEALVRLQHDPSGSSPRNFTRSAGLVSSPHIKIITGERTIQLWLTCAATHGQVLDRPRCQPSSVSLVRLGFCAVQAVVYGPFYRTLEISKTHV